MKKLLLTSAAAMVLSTSALAQTTDFPEGAEQLTQEALREALAGKVFSMTPAKGPDWRWQFDNNGYFFFNAGSYTNSGKWSTKDSTVCQDTGKTTGCNPMRQKDGVLYLKRGNGELLTFKPQ
ncbi:hypothetical protein [Acidovorax sp. A79]|uniref:hypothetical protein n=1 Tax=Acidovorax sp. A79 TaxID=3056107 RepID=UPI0034E8BD78